MVFCPECGFNNDKNSKYCEECGEPLQENVLNTKRSTKSIIFIGLFFFLLSGTSIGILLNNNFTSSSQPNLMNSYQIQSNPTNSNYQSNSITNLNLSTQNPTFQNPNNTNEEYGSIYYDPGYQMIFYLPNKKPKELDPNLFENKPYTNADEDYDNKDTMYTSR